MTPQQQADKVISRLIGKIEAFVVTVCLIIITFCLVYAYLVYPTMDKKKNNVKVAYEEFRRFSMPLGDITGTEEYEDKTVRTYTDDWGIRYDVKQRTK
jgi:hypothetical protein